MELASVYPKVKWEIDFTGVRKKCAEDIVGNYFLKSYGGIKNYQVRFTDKKIVVRAKLKKGLVFRQEYKNN